MMGTRKTETKEGAGEKNDLIQKSRCMDLTDRNANHDEMTQN